jgi:hypothetical protein
MFSFSAFAFSLIISLKRVRGCKQVKDVSERTWLIVISPFDNLLRIAFTCSVVTWPMVVCAKKQRRMKKRRFFGFI